jgi:hemolysin III
MWTPKVRTNLRRLDRSMIYVFVAGTYTPLVVKLGPALWPYTLQTVWAAALTGVAVAVFVTGAPRWVTALPYVVLGWGAVMLLPAVYSNLGANPFWFFAIGGLLYTLGAVSYAFKRPDPFPTVYGYHEIFHLLVIIAAALHYAAIFGALT